MNLSCTYYSHWKIWQNSLNRWFLYLRHVKYFDFSILSMSSTSRTLKRRSSRMTSISWILSLLSHVVGLPRAYSIGLPFLLSLNLLCQVYTNVQETYLCLNRGQTCLNTVMNDKSARRIIIRRCHFWKFLTKGVCTYNVKKYIYEVIL